METTTLDQKIARKEAELARLRQKSRSLETGQKIVLGGLLLNAAKNDPAIRKWLLAEIPKAVTREVDRKRIAPIVGDLQRLHDAQEEVKTYLKDQPELPITEDQKAWANVKPTGNELI